MKGEEKETLFYLLSQKKCVLLRPQRFEAWRFFRAKVISTEGKIIGKLHNGT